MKTFKKHDSRPYTKNRGFGGGFKGGFGGGRGRDTDGGRPELHTATCVRCESTCQVPFRPNGSKPIFCDSCFGKDAYGNTSGRGPRSGSDRPAFGGRDRVSGDRGGDASGAALRALEAKLDTIIRLLENK